MSGTKRRLLEPISRTPLVEIVIGRLRELLDSGQYEPGDRLPSERALGEDLRVGRSTIREALRALEALGLIELHQGRGAFVRTSDSQPGEEAPFADWPRSYHWRIADVIEARVAIEQAAAALAAGRRTSDHIESMRAALHAFAEAAARRDVPALVLADVAFHDAIAEAANPVLASLLKSMRSYGIRSRYTSLGRRERWKSVRVRHEAIYDAIVAGDAGSAAQRMERHLLEFARELRVKVHALGGGAADTSAADGRRRKRPRDDAGLKGV